MAIKSDIAPGEVEVLAQRNLSGKTFLRPDGKVRVVHSAAPVHWHDGVQWVDVDHEPVTPDGGKTWTTASTPYVLSWDSETLTLSYQSKKGGDVQVRLTHLDGSPVGKSGLPTVNGQSITAFVAPELEIEIRIRPYGVEIFKILHGPSAPTNLTWEVVEGDTTNIKLDLMNTAGRDNQNNSAQRKLGSGLNQNRRLEITHAKSADDFAANPGKNTYSVVETFTGRTRFIDPSTRARAWVDEVEYPAVIDVTITELIVANADDGNARANDEWYSNSNDWRTGKAYSTDDHGGVRFQTVNVPQGQTLDSATLTINVTTTGASGTEAGIIAGQATDNATSWANYSAGNTPRTMAATTATVSFNNPSTTGIKNITVTTIVQEIVNRAGWVANNNMRLGWTDVSAMTSSYMKVEDYQAAAGNPAKLVIVYTASGGAFAPYFYRQHIAGGMHGESA